MEYPKFKVCVRCFTFNHSDFITDAMNGFAMQQTDFPFVCCIVDDASTDGEQEVIRKYVEDNFDLSEDSCHFEREADYAFTTYAQHKTNKNCYFAVLYLKENHHSIKKTKMPYLTEWRDMCEYEALCEGDDWWIDSNKLQKQVNFLDAHSDYSLCFHNAIVIYDEEKLPARLFNDFPKSSDVMLEQLLSKWIIPTASIMHRMDVYSNYPEWTKQIYSGDLTISLIAYSKGKVYSMYDVMSVYRINYKPDSATSRIKGHAQYEMQQQVLLLQYFNSYTKNAYSDCVNYFIKLYQDRYNYSVARKRGFFVAFFEMPKYCISRCVNRLSKLFYTI